MAIDSDITIANLVTQALKNAGRVVPTAAQISDATAYQFRRVKSDIALKSGQHEALRADYAQIVSEGISRFTWPTDAHSIRSVSLLEAPDAYTGIAQAGANGSITLSTTTDVSDPNDLQGKFIVLLGGTGANQIRQIYSWSNTTKVALTTPNWTTNPAVGTTYMIATDHRLLWSLDKQREWYTNPAPGSRGKPTSGAFSGREFWLNTAPDKIYALWWDYYAHLDLLDNTSDVVLKHIRMYYSLWTQGLSAWLCQRYDEDRYTAELQVYENLLSSYEQESSHLTTMQFTDL